MQNHVSNTNHLTASEPLTESVTESTSDLFSTVADAIVSFAEEYQKTNHIAHRLCGYIRRSLRRTRHRSMAEAVRVSHKAADCDLTIGDNIAIKILYGLHSESNETIQKRLRSLLDRYDHLLIYGHEISQEHTDNWRQIRRSLSQYTTTETKLWCHATVSGTQHRIPFTEGKISRTVIEKFGVYLLLLGFAAVSAQALITAGDGSMMGSAFVGMIIVFNAVVVVLGLAIAKA